MGSKRQCVLNYKLRYRVYASIWLKKLSITIKIYMKHVLFVLIVFCLVQVSCAKKDPDNSIPNSLEGKWRMILVKDNTSGLATTKPFSVQGEVEITFTAASSTNGTFTGFTPTNEISPNDYTVGINQSISIPNLSITKVMETTWGNQFVENIRSSQQYSFETGNKLTIKTTSKILTFLKL